MTAEEDASDRIEYLGLAASLLTTTAYLPQVVKTWRTRSADDFSLPTLIMLVVGIGLWTIYGVLRDAPAVWFGNGVTVVLAAYILSVKLQGSPPSRVLRHYIHTWFLARKECNPR